MKVFLLKVLIVKRSQKLCHVQFTLYWLIPGVLIYCLKSWHQKHGDEFEKHPFCTNMRLWVGISWKASGLGASVCCLFIICGTWRREEVARGFLNLSYGGKRKNHRQEELLWSSIKKLPKELTTELLYLELPTISGFCSVKRYMHYIRFLLTNKTS